MKYGKLNENQSGAVPPQPPPNELPPEEQKDLIQDNESDKELFMETEKKLKHSSTKKTIIYCGCGFLALIVVALFVGYVFQGVINTDNQQPDQDKPNNTTASSFIQSPTDIHRTFKLITLNNSLQILLISDNQTDKCAAAIDVSIGSSEDPNQYLGLAHFHEHMLFLGSETYPTEDAFSGYVSMNGGSDNAYTDKTHTNFFFEINNNHFSDALHIFSRFFIDPLLTYDAIMNEIWAVDNEYRKDIPNQDWRNWRTIEYTANSKDPFSKFSIGSINTLNKSGIYDQMKAFHNKYFVSNIMKGVIYGNENIETLNSYAIKYFSDVPQSDIESPQYENTNPYSNEQIGKIYFIKPIDSTKTLSFLWSFVGSEYNLYSNYRSPVLTVIDNIITSKTEQSLYHFLAKSKGWIHDITGEIFYNEYHWSGYLLSVELTDSGLINYQNIAKYLFEAIHILLENINELELTYNNYICMEKLQFKFYSLIKQTAYDVVSDIARRMQYRDQKDLLYTQLNVPPVRSVYNQTLIENVLNYMNDPNNIIIYQIADNFTDYNLKEPYFQIEYSIIDISEELIHEWQWMSGTSLKFEYNNPYIDDKCNLNNVKLIELSGKDKTYYSKPELIVNETNMTVWYKPDTQFNSSEIAINLLLISPLISNDIMNVTYMNIWIQLMEYMSSEWYSQPSDAGYTFDLSIDNQGIVIEINCINSEYLEEFITEFFNYFMDTIKIYITDNNSIELILNNILNNLYDKYNNINYESIWHQGYYKMYDTVEIPYYSHVQMLNQISNLLNQQNTSIILENLLNFISSVKQYGFLLEALFNGNIYKTDIENIYLPKILANINIRDTQYLSNNNFLNNIPTFKHVNLKLNEINQWVYQGYNSNPDDTNDVNEFYFQFNENSNHLDTCKVLLISKIMSSESFEVLRTQEALGYVATTFSRTTLLTNDINYIVVLVASGRPEYNAGYLQERIIHFINYFYETFLNEKIDNESFESYINATISDIKPQWLTLSDETTFLWNQIMGHTYFWSKSNEFERLLRSDEITLNKIKEFYELNMLGENRKWLSVQLYSNKSILFENNITRYNYNLNNEQVNGYFKDEFVFFNSAKDIQKVNDIAFFDVY